MRPSLSSTPSPRKPSGLSVLAIVFALALGACGADDDVRPNTEDTDIIDETDAGDDTDADPDEDAGEDTDPDEDAGEDTDIDPGPTCGDDLLEGDESCDGTDLGGETCITRGFDGGELGCDASCGFDTSECFDEVPQTCGDDELNQETEACDGNDLAGETCLTQGFDGGTLACSESCGFDTSGCVFDPVCGDDLINTDEEACDGADLAEQTCETLGFDGGSLACSDTCGFDTSGCTTDPICGDSTINQTSESCDGDDLNGETCVSQGFDGGTLACSDTCGFDTSGCTIDPICGDAEVNQPSESCDGIDLDGETCLTQGFDGGTLACNTSCGFDTSACTTDPICGDDAVNQASELCDGDDLNGETCVSQGFGGGTLGCNASCGFDTSACTAAPVCGDAEVNQPSESCDGIDLNGETCVSQGFDRGTLACNTSCGFDTSGCIIDPICGDDAINQSSESCDGADLGGESCTSLGFGAGTLSCTTSCDFDTSACPVAVVCTDVDNGEPNNSRAQATALTSGVAYKTAICSGDVDHYILDAAVGCSIDADLIITGSSFSTSQDIDLELSTENVRLDKSAAGGSTAENVSGLATTSRYYFNVEPFNTATSAYTLTANAISCPAAPSCPTDDIFQPNDDVDTSYALEGPLAFFDAALCEGASEDWYEIYVPAGCTINADITFTDDDGDLDLYLYEPTTLFNVTNYVVRGFSSTDDETLTHDATASGVYKIRVDGWSDSTNTYGFRTEVVCPAHLELSCPADDMFAPNHSADTAVAISPDDVIDGILCGERSTFSVSAHSDFYQVALPDSGNLTMSLFSHHALGDLNLALLDASGNRIQLTDTQQSDREELTSVFLVQGTYTLEVYGNTPDDFGKYFLRTTFEPTP